MRVAIITEAGISSRFNEGIPEENKVLKCLYGEEGPKSTLLYHLMKKCSYADQIVLVGGYRFEDLCAFYERELKEEFPNTVLVKNDHFADLNSGYSLCLGIHKALESEPDEILFIEGDLDVDDESFEKVIQSAESVLTYTSEPIYANKAVVLYQTGDGRYKYAFNSNHGLLQIEEPFSCILNSGQTWKFTDVNALRKANEEFEEKEIDGTNLRIIGRYIDSVPKESVRIIKLERWINCNTREDYRRIASGWRGSL